MSGSPGSLRALHRAAEEAGGRGAELVAVLAWQSPDGALAQRRAVFPTMVDFRREAVERLRNGLDAAFGCAGPGVAWQGLAALGAPGPALVAIAERPDDLLVLGAGRRCGWRRAVVPSVVRYCVKHAGCPVLAVPPSPLEADLASLHGRFGRWLPLDTRQLMGGGT
ncbi:universal stress protein [Streptomyces sp. NPDC055189]